jgi:hypothetical protein
VCREVLEDFGNTVKGVGHCIVEDDPTQAGYVAGVILKRRTTL